jgi:hypothetical protein
MGNPSEGEFIVVRLGRDEVPFAPPELALSPRARSAVKFTPGKTAAAAKSAPAKSAPPRKTAGRKSTAKKATATRTTAAPAKEQAAKAAPVRAASVNAAPAKAARVKAVPAKAAAATTMRSATRRRRTSGKRGAAQPLTVTVRYADDRWTVEAQRGSRRLTRPSQLRPGAVKAFAELVDDDAIRDAITGIVESGRAVIEERALKLRAELELAEASLRDYESRRR